MGFGHIQVSSPRYELLGRNGGTGTTVAASATPDTKGSWVTIGTTSFVWDGFYITNGRSGVATTGGAYRIDVAVNTGGSDEIIVEDLSSSGVAWYLQAPGPVYLPVQVPAGATLKMRCQSSSGGDFIYPSILGVAGDGHYIRGSTQLRSATDWSNSIPANGGWTFSGTTLTSWLEVISSTPERFAYLYFGLSNPLGVTILDVMFEIGTGVAGVENTLFTIHAYDDSQNGAVGGPLGRALGPYACDIPPGTRLAVRAQSAYGAAAGSISPCLWGLAA